MIGLFGICLLGTLALILSIWVINKIRLYERVYRGIKTITVSSGAGFGIGDELRVGNFLLTIVDINGNFLTVIEKRQNAHQ